MKVDKFIHLDLELHENDLKAEKYFGTELGWVLKFKIDIINQGPEIRQQSVCLFGL